MLFINCTCACPACAYFAIYISGNTHNHLFIFSPIQSEVEAAPAVEGVTLVAETQHRQDTAVVNHMYMYILVYIYILCCCGNGRFIYKCITYTPHQYST